MTTFSYNAPFNPNTIRLILVLFIKGLTVMHTINIRFKLEIVCLIGFQACLEYDYDPTTKRRIT